MKDSFSRYFSEFYLNIGIAFLAVGVAIVYACYGGYEAFSRNWIKDVSAGSFVVMFFGNFILRTVAAKNREKNNILTKVMHEITMEKKKEEELNTRYNNFLNFLKNKKQQQYNILFPDLGEEGLAYNISAVRKDDGTPHAYEDEINILYLIKINEISYYNVLKDEDLVKYEDSPIKVSEYYFCSFYDGYWHMANSTSMTNLYKFIKLGMTGRVRSSTQANSFAGTTHNPLEYEIIKSVIVDENGIEASSGDLITILKRLVDAEIFLQINKSPLKKIFLTSKSNEFGENVKWFLVIEYIDGYGSKLFTEGLIKIINDVLDQKKLKLKKIPWYKNSREMKRNSQS